MAKKIKNRTLIRNIFLATGALVVVEAAEAVSCWVLRGLFNVVGSASVTAAHKDRKIRKHFKIVVENGFWGSSVKYIERDVPLTEEQLDAMELEFKTA